MTRHLPRPLWALAAALAAALFSAPAMAVTIDVFAQANSVVGGSPLDTNIDLTAGDQLVINVPFNDLWSAGSGGRTSNANGLGPGNPFGGNFGFFTLGSQSFLYGALVGRIGAGDYFLVGTSFDALVSDSGRLFLAYWDANSGDNSGSVTATIRVNPNAGPTGVAEPGTLLLFGTGLAGLGLMRRRRKAA